MRVPDEFFKLSSAAVFWMLSRHGKLSTFAVEGECFADHMLQLAGAALDDPSGPDLSSMMLQSEAPTTEQMSHLLREATRALLCRDVTPDENDMVLTTVELYRISCTVRAIGQVGPGLLQEALVNRMKMKAESVQLGWFGRGKAAREAINRMSEGSSHADSLLRQNFDYCGRTVTGTAAAVRIVWFVSNS